MAHTGGRSTASPRAARMSKCSGAFVSAMFALDYINPLLALRAPICGFLSSRSVAVEVLDGSLVAPNNQIARPGEDRGDSIPFLGTRRPPAQQDRQNPLLLHPGPLRQLPGINPGLDAQLLHGF